MTQKTKKYIARGQFFDIVNIYDNLSRIFHTRTCSSRWVDECKQCMLSNSSAAYSKSGVKKTDNKYST